ncbi:MAG: glutaminyl-peptide cyclotransferase, partial [Anaerolineae bacterium]|nr:glutaminyl-peptide cyclotransferase [Anaerolineae bacterium]
MRRFLFIGFAGAMVFASAMVSAQTATPRPTITAVPAASQTHVPVEFFVADVLNTYPHDTTAFTEGLIFHDGLLYESAGETGESDLREVDLETGEILRRTRLDEQSFAEGLALVDDVLIQLTWMEEIAFVYDLNSFKQIDTFAYSGEGWGLCYDGDLLWKSDGTATLKAHDSQTFEVVRELPITYQGYSLDQIATESGRTMNLVNELECVDGLIYANVWFTDYILRIDPTSGHVTGVIDASKLITDEERAALMAVDTDAVLNGIAYNPQTESFFLTGKYWPKLFEVQFKPLSTP